MKKPQGATKPPKDRATVGLRILITPRQNEVLLKLAKVTGENKSFVARKILHEHLDGGKRA